MRKEELNKLLMPFHDGELDPATAAEVERSLTEHPEARAELAELELINVFARDAFTAPEAVAEVDLSGVYEGVMARIAAEEPEAAIEGVRVQRQSEQGLWDRMVEWFGELLRFERPLAAAGMMAALLVVVGGFWLGQRAGDPGNAITPEHKMTMNRPRTPRRAAEGEVKVQSAAVDAIADRGELKVIELGDDDESALVLWHVVEGEGVDLPSDLEPSAQDGVNGKGTGL